MKKSQFIFRTIASLKSHHVRCLSHQRNPGILFQTPYLKIGNTDPCTHFIDGHCVRGQQCFDLVNPATGEIASACPDASEATLNMAVESAAACFNSDAWSTQPSSHRSSILREIANSIIANSEQLARAETVGCGKLLSDSRLDVEEAAGRAHLYSTRPPCR